MLLLLVSNLFLVTIKIIYFSSLRTCSDGGGRSRGCGCCCGCGCCGSVSGGCSSRCCCSSSSGGSSSCGGSSTSGCKYGLLFDQSSEAN